MITLNFFRGYYFKHQINGQTIAFIPGMSKHGAFVQVITPWESNCFYYSHAKFGKNIQVGDNIFSSKGIKISLPGISGSIRYGKLTPLHSDIMGIFRFFPMECRHVIISMRHTLKGSLTINGNHYDFHGGTGYIEGDSGRSFPSRYVWIQANDFPDKSSITISLAKIPFCGFHFFGAFAVLILQGKEYRLATYLGVRVSDKKDIIIFRQGDLTLVVRILSQGTGYPLASPKNGVMNGIIKEHNDSCVNIRLWKGKRMLCNLTSRHAGYERFPEN